MLQQQGQWTAVDLLMLPVETSPPQRRVSKLKFTSINQCQCQVLPLLGGQAVEEGIAKLVLPDCNLSCLHSQPRTATSGGKPR
jgi:hypothetical protein